jgi:hypothetical protein
VILGVVPTLVGVAALVATLVLGGGGASVATVVLGGRASVVGIISGASALAGDAETEVDGAAGMLDVATAFGSLFAGAFAFAAAAAPVEGDIMEV